MSEEREHDTKCIDNTGRMVMQNVKRTSINRTDRKA